ncbi:SDR family NAD(P)-dependent oxidoreductase [Variovorax ginsengisoli]|uniref:SDR family NAD(P)-dependent oxidoreductase n=1 Tax=Variovorax ginsengisoli TaxID=363844 RepID=A0ABT8SD74_9BURK|nr:SDR family NAD(P)-dependent oxidoreductase [Variovorax ginsengisoli]MDN8617705.1 SDR family NAD(P)-dependent oxidoreductase [Variovorax ginsengisoli]MDO1536875.1 SDR family NAD(P)-dependent oxidoreductase [Variovorax ginsengisoli]
MAGTDTKFLAECFGLSGLTVVVTGAGSGIGRQAALTLAATGAEVALLGRREQALRETADLITERGGRARRFCVDVTHRQAVSETLDEVQGSMAPLWALVNNAGVGGRAALLEVSEAQVDQILGVNTKAALFVATAFAERLIARELPGRIINICSLAAQTHPLNLAIYGASKAALEHLTRSMAREWSSHRINVNAINPGYIETDINRAMFQTPAGRKVVEGLPRQRLGTPDALDGVLLLLASTASAFITGSTLVVDDAQRFGVS